MILHDRGCNVEHPDLDPKLHKESIALALRAEGLSHVSEASLCAGLRPGRRSRRPSLLASCPPR